MTLGTIKIATILAKVAAGEITVAQLQAKLNAGMERVNRIGYKNVSKEVLQDLACIESAIKRIKLAKRA